MNSPTNAFPDPSFRPAPGDFAFTTADSDMLAGRPNILDGQMRRGHWAMWRIIVQVVVPAVAVLVLASLAIWGQNLSLRTLEIICGVVIVTGLATIIITTLVMFSRRHAIKGLVLSFATAGLALGLLALAG